MTEENNTRTAINNFDTYGIEQTPTKPNKITDNNATNHKFDN